MPTITFSRKDITEAVQKLQSIIPNRPSLAVLSSILVAVQKTTVTLTTTDLQMGLSITIPASADAELSFTILGKPFVDLVKTLFDDQVTLSLEGSELTLQSGTVTTVMQTQSAEEFPAFPSAEGETLAFDRLEIEEIQQRAVPSVSPDTARPLLTGVLLDPLNAPLAVATDGFRLSLLTLAKKTAVWKERVVIPARFFSELLRALSDTVKEVEISYSVAQKQVVVSLGGSMLFSRTLDGEYPPYEKIIPSSSESTIAVSGADLLDQVKRAVIFSRESMNAVQIAASNEGVVVKAQSPTSGQFSGVVQSAKFTGPAITIAFNSRYLLDYLQVVGDEEIVIAMTDSLKPVLITTAAMKEWQYVVMPFKLNT